MRITIDLTTQETEALRLAYEHVRIDMAQKHGWEMRDAALDAISKVLTSSGAHLLFDHHGDQEVAALRLAYEHVRVDMAQKHGWAVRDAALAAINKIHKALAATPREPLEAMTEQETEALRLAYEHVRVDLPQELGRTMRDAALDAISKALTAPIKAIETRRLETQDEED